MSEFRRTTPDDLYFITLTIVGWIDVFSRQSQKDILVENLEYGIKNEKLEIYCYVIMSNHIHMICRRREEDLKEFIGRFKSVTAKKILTEIKSDVRESRKDWMLREFRHFAQGLNQYSEFHVWQYTDHPILLYDNRIIDQKRDYIHMNPVKAGLVKNPADYVYSSASPDSPLKVIAL